MNKHIRTRALFIHRFPALASGNTPVVLLTEELGKVRALVKGLQKAKSRMASRMDPLLFLEVELYRMDSSSFLLTSAAVLERFADHSLSFDRIEALWQVWGAANVLLPEEEPQPDAMELLTEFLALLPTVQYPQVLADMTLCKLLVLLGHVFIHEKCMHCGRDIRQEEELLLRVEDMLIIGRECEAKMGTAIGLTRIPHLVYKTLRLYQEKGLQLADVVKIPDLIVKKAHDIIFERLQIISGK